MSLLLFLEKELFKLNEVGGALLLFELDYKVLKFFYSEKEHLLTFGGVWRFPEGQEVFAFSEESLVFVGSILSSKVNRVQLYKELLLLLTSKLDLLHKVFSCDSFILTLLDIG